MEDFKVISRGGKRYYVKDGVMFPSVTTIIKHRSEFTDRGGFISNAARIGTLIHYAILKQFAPTPIEMPQETIWKVPPEVVYDKIKRAMMMYKGLNLDFQFEDVEVPVFYQQEGMRYAGRLDAVGVYKGERAILDLKSGMDYSYYNLQMGAYANAVGAEMAFLVFLDTNETRNPSGNARVKVLDKGDLKNGYVEFKEAYQEFIKEL